MIAGKRASKLSFEILLAESYLLLMSIIELEREIKHKTSGDQARGQPKIWGAWLTQAGNNNQRWSLETRLETHFCVFRSQRLHVSRL